MILTHRKATVNDVKLFFNWANNPAVRKASFYSEPILWANHVTWFNKKINSPNSLLLVFEYQNKPVGPVRIDFDNDAIIGISIDEEYRGKGFATQMLNTACNLFWQTNNKPVFAYIKPDNKASIKSFIKAGFIYYKNDIINNTECIVYVATNKL